MTRDELRTELERILIIYDEMWLEAAMGVSSLDSVSEALDMMMCAVDEYNKAEAIAWALT